MSRGPWSAASADNATEGLGTEGGEVEQDGKADKSVVMFI